MTATGTIALLTDFGLSDTYIGVMKGVIAQVNRALTIIDLTHDIPPQNIAAASFNLACAYPYFGNGTVFIAVVDPGVGSSRRSIAVQFENGFLVGPDNGIFTGVLRQIRAIAVVELTNSAYWRVPKPSHTFHGRDIFASVGAHLASGVPIQALGRPVQPSSLIGLPIPECLPLDDRIVGCVQYIDRFGNAISNIPGELVRGKTWVAVVGDRAIPSVETYSASDRGALIALIGSDNWVEIAVNCGNAQVLLQVELGDPVEVRF